MEPTCLNIIFIHVCVCNTCGFHCISIFLFRILASPGRAVVCNLSTNCSKIFWKNGFEDENQIGKSMLNIFNI